MENNKTIYINFFDGIDGGDVDSGFVLYNYLVSLRPTIKIGMHNIGKIDSPASASVTLVPTNKKSSFL